MHRPRRQLNGMRRPPPRELGGDLRRLVARQLWRAALRIQRRHVPRQRARAAKVFGVGTPRPCALPVVARHVGVVVEGRAVALRVRRARVLGRQDGAAALGAALAAPAEDEVPHEGEQGKDEDGGAGDGAGDPGFGVAGGGCWCVDGRCGDAGGHGGGYGGCAG